MSSPPNGYCLLAAPAESSLSPFFLRLEAYTVATTEPPTIATPIIGTAGLMPVSPSLSASDFVGVASFCFPVVLPELLPFVLLSVSFVSFVTVTTSCFASEAASVDADGAA